MNKLGTFGNYILRICINFYYKKINDLQVDIKKGMRIVSIVVSRLFIFD